MDQYEELAQLGGEIEEHLASAVELYLESQRPDFRGPLSVEMIQHAAVAVINKVHFDETLSDDAEDYEDEWFDPTDYEEEPRVEGMFFR